MLEPSSPGIQTFLVYPSHKGPTIHFSPSQTNKGPTAYFALTHKDPTPHFLPKPMKASQCILAYLS